MRALTIAAFLVMINCPLLFSQDIKLGTYIIKSPNVPVEISIYKAGYYKENDFINHEIEFSNVSGKDILALQFVFVGFDAFKDYNWLYSGANIELIKAGAKKKWPVTQKRFENVLYMSLYSHIFVDKVTFSDYTVWKSDRKYISEEINKISTFDINEFRRFEPYYK